MKQRKQTFAFDDNESFDIAKEIVLSDVQVERKIMMDIAVFSEKKFKGSVIPVPEVLIKYLNATEFRVFCTIFVQIVRHGVCYCRRDYLAAEAGVSLVSVSSALANMESMEIIESYYEEGGKGARKHRKINFKAVQYLNDLLSDRKPGAERALRKEMGEKSVLHPTPTALMMLDIQYSYRDEIEDEEYI